MWANLYLLFWLSLFPFATGWMGENHFTAAPTALYGVVLLMAAITYLVLPAMGEGPHLFTPQDFDRPGVSRVVDV